MKIGDRVKAQRPRAGRRLAVGPGKAVDARGVVRVASPAVGSGFARPAAPLPGSLGTLAEAAHSLAVLGAATLVAPLLLLVGEDAELALSPADVVVDHREVVGRRLSFLNELCDLRAVGLKGAQDILALSAEEEAFFQWAAPSRSSCSLRRSGAGRASDNAPLEALR